MSTQDQQLSKELNRKEEYIKFVENKQYRHAEEVWHRLHRGTYLKDLVYGANDGIITTFAVVSGAAGAALSPAVVVILGLANLFADGFSMGASNLLSLKSQSDFEKMQRKREEWETENFPEIEKEEVKKILKKWGIPEHNIEEAVPYIIQDKKRWVDLMMREELEIVESDDTKALWHGFATFGAFVLAGFMPLLPYMFSVSGDMRFPVSIGATGLSLFIVGAARTLITETNWLKSGIQMLFVGGVAASAAFTIGWVVKTFLGIGF